jgi:hypothetical protein
MEYTRADDALPLATEEWGWKYHHIGIPVFNPIPGEQHIPHLGIYVKGFSSSPYGIEFMRFEPHSQVHELVKTVPHIAFVVEDLIKALQGKELLYEVNSPSPGLKVAMIVHNGAPIELMEFTKGG